MARPFRIEFPGGLYPFHYTDAAATDRIRRGVAGLSPVEGDAALAQRHPAGDGLHQRGLADAVAAEQADHLADTNADRHAMQHMAEAVVGCTLLSSSMIFNLDGIESTLAGAGQTQTPTRPRRQPTLPHAPAGRDDSGYWRKKASGFNAGTGEVLKSRSLRVMMNCAPQAMAAAA